MHEMWNPRRSLPGKVRRRRQFERSLLGGFLDGLETLLRQCNRVSVLLWFFIVRSMICGFIAWVVLMLVILGFKVLDPLF